MRIQTIGVLLSSLVLAASACNDDADDEPAQQTAPRPLIQQVPPPLDLKEPPKDATKTASGLIYKKLAARDTGEVAKRSDTVMVRYTGWRQSTGQTFFTMNGGADALGIDVAHAAPKFGEALQQLRKGEKAVLWVPPGEGTTETLVYEVEVVDIKSSTAVASRTTDKKNLQLDAASAQQQPAASAQQPANVQQPTKAEPNSSKEPATSAGAAMMMRRLPATARGRRR
jgi:hypothetical protein